MIIASLLGGMVGLGLIAAATWTYYNQQNKMAKNVGTLGIVVDLTRELMDPGSPGVYCPIVEFTLPSSEKIRFTSKFGSRPASHKVGQSVNVRYDPVDPQNAEIDTALSNWLVPGILAFIGIIFCCLSVFLVPLFWVME